MLGVLFKCRCVSLILRYWREILALQFLLMHIWHFWTGTQHNSEMKVDLWIVFR